MPRDDEQQQRFPIPPPPPPPLQGPPPRAVPREPTPFETFRAVREELERRGVEVTQNRMAAIRELEERRARIAWRDRGAGF